MSGCSHWSPRRKMKGWKLVKHLKLDADFFLFLCMLTEIIFLRFGFLRRKHVCSKITKLSEWLSDSNPAWVTWLVLGHLEDQPVTHPGLKALQSAKKKTPARSHQQSTTTHVQVIVGDASTAADLPFLLLDVFLQALQVGHEGLVEGRQVKVLHRRPELSGTAKNANWTVYDIAGAMSNIPEWNPSPVPPY